MSIELLPTPPPLEPLAIVQTWLATATASGRLRNPNAMALATVSGDRPSVRFVLLKSLDTRDGFAVFFTNYHSRKATELELTGHAAAVLYWEELGRQVRFEGPVVRTPAAESDAYYASRPWRSQLNAWVSMQSEPLQSHAELERQTTRFERQAPTRFGRDVDTDRPLPRPPHWGGHRLWLDTVELWAEGQNRFHERLQYRRTLDAHPAGRFAAGPWSVQLLKP